MLGSSLPLAMGTVLLAAVRLSGRPQALGLVVFIGVVLVALACAMHLGASIDQRRELRARWRIPAKATAWLLIAAGTGWAVERAPGDELLVALMVTPIGVGLVGLLAARDDRWSAAAFLALGVLLLGVVGPVWLERQAR